MQYTSEVTTIDLDALLRPVLKRTMGSPQTKLRASIRKALETEGVDLEEARDCLRRASKGAVLRARADSTGMQQGSCVEEGSIDNRATVVTSSPTVWSLVNYDRSWNKLVRQVEQRISCSPSPEEARAEMIWQLHARVLLPYPAETDALMKRNVNGRAAYTAVAMMLIDDAETRIAARTKTALDAQVALVLSRSDAEREAAELAIKRATRIGVIDTAIVTANTLATKLGWYPTTAANNLEFLVEVGYLQKTNATGAGRYRLTALSDDERAAVDELHGSSIESYIAGKTSGLSNLIVSVAHPAFTHGDELTHNHWLVAVANFAQTPVSVFGIPRSKEIQLQRELSAHGLDPAIASFPLYRELLDEIAGRPAADGHTAWERQQLAAEIGTARAVASTERILTHRDGKKRAYTLIDKLVDKYPIPAQPNTGRRSDRAQKMKSLKTWKKDMRQVFSGRSLDEKVAETAAQSLRARLLESGYGPEYAQATAHEVIYGEQPEPIV